ncbi:MAG: hypothetical protein JST81_08880 [Bacteroidetes bacterium]|nr:hypothetical protein [Bacteroidota bacterium]
MLYAHNPVKRNTSIALANLLIVAGIGVVMRYKIAYSLPIVDQKNLLHGHSHFAFAGWISHALMLLLIQYLAGKKGNQVFKKYRWVLTANLITAYGMLISFPIQGYGLYAILFSTLSIFVSYAFCIMYWKDLNSLPEFSVSHWWMKLSLLFNALSSIGAFSLAFMMAAKITNQHWYLASVYFFLHFQYNGWFFFACMGLAMATFLHKIPIQKQKIIFWLFAGACVPAYILSALWLPLPAWTYYIVVIAACSQVLGLYYVITEVRKQFPHLLTIIDSRSRWIFLLVLCALSIKLLLQLASVIPSLSTLAFGFRPIVIGYLHLILLGVISLFLLGYMAVTGNLQLQRNRLFSLRLFVFGVILNEIILMIQGIADITFLPLPFINEALLAASIIMFSGLLLLNFSRSSN